MSDGFRVLVCGGRHYCGEAKVFAHLDKLHAERPIDCIVENGETGVATFAVRWAIARGVNVVGFQSDWRRFAGRADTVRNQRILKEGLPDLVVAFDIGFDAADLVAKAQQAGIPVVRAG